MFPGGQFVKSAGFISSASSVHCSTGPQQNVDDDYCACRVKAVGRGGRPIHIIRAPHFFLNRIPARSKSGPVFSDMR